MVQQISIEDYLKKFYPRILQQYKDYSKTYEELTPRKICEMDIDYSNISGAARNSLKENGIIKVGHLVRVLVLYKNIKWIAGVGKATCDRLYNQLAPLDIDIRHMDNTDSDVISYAYRNYKRCIRASVTDVFGDTEFADECKSYGWITVGDVIWAISNSTGLDLLRRQELSVRNVFAKYAPTFDGLLKEFSEDR